ncbi:MAG: tRNA lysidine(34) synthetase TilS [Mariprofundaceae bacterium]|nr:tRNA lysidine(34) synthetase TilS [Mariprofundaceae bacterium]
MAIGWSGGIDSTALLLALHNMGFQLHAWHVDHAWHDASYHEANQLALLAKSWGIPFTSRRLAKAPASNREARARQGRYQAFQEMAEATNITVLALGHHADDQAETVCMRMLQGSGIMGCRGIGLKSERGSLCIYRPFLHVPRLTLKQALQAAKIKWLEDASNHDLSLWRNRIRLRLFPEISANTYDPSDLFLRWQKQAVLLSATINREADTIQLHKTTSGCFISWYAWQNLSQAARAQVLQRMAPTVLGAGRVFGRRHIELIEFWQKRGGHGGLDLSSCRLSHLSEHLHLEWSKASSRA